ncbi:hypothetical protein LTR53_000812 [Teratosphaeriaceae sp. CCFEE 6253]|nr:hypothetical protein LTR53_000812 [Teratosphaeriaceae sp. CCFEE 6253]
MAPSMYELLAVSVGRETATPAFLLRGSFYLKCQFASTLLFWTCLWSVKASFLAFFRQLTANLKWPRMAWWVVTIITTLAFIGSIITYPVSCTSFVLVIAIPISIVARVQVSTLQKIALIAVLGLGVIIVGFAIARIIVTDTQGVHPEISWLALWSAIESSVAVIVCCLASFKSLFTAQRQGSSRRAYGAQNSGARRRASGGASAGMSHGEVRMVGASSAKQIPLRAMKNADYGVGQELDLDDSSSQLEILGDRVRDREVT